MKILLIRHGQTDWNLASKVQGHIDIKLNETGIKQAYITRDLLKDTKIDLILCSPLDRAKMTADIINNNRNINIIVDDRLIERNLGSYEGLNFYEFNIDPVWSYKTNLKYDGLENIRKFFNRIYEFLSDIKIKYRNKTVLIVSHSGVSIAVECYFKGVPINDDLSLLKMKNCEIREYYL